MVEAHPQPLLSICIPTFNRAHFLKVMLEALLPQVRECGSAVEVWVLDNGSEDTTASVVEDAQNLGPLKVHRHPHNVGPLRNIIHGPLNLATAKFCWVLGDHNLLRPGGLQRVIECLRTNSQIEAFYVNFRTATWPRHWPESAISGFDGEHDLVANPESEHGLTPFWHELLRAQSSAGTQSYAHILKTEHWKTFWHTRTIGKDYTSAETTYPHTVTVAECCLNRPAFFIGTPVLTIFNGAQSWTNVNNLFKVYFIGLPDLIRTLHRMGLKKTKVRMLTTQFLIPCASGVITDSLRTLGARRTLSLFINAIGVNWRCWVLLLMCAKWNVMAYVVDIRPFHFATVRPIRWIQKRLPRMKSVRTTAKTQATHMDAPKQAAPSSESVAGSEISPRQDARSNEPASTAKDFEL